MSSVRDPHYAYHAQQYLLRHPEVATFSERRFLSAMQAASSSAAYHYARQGLQYASTKDGRRLPTSLDTIQYAMDFLEKPITATVDSHVIRIAESDDYEPPLFYQTEATMRCSLKQGDETVIKFLFRKSSDEDKMEVRFERKSDDPQEQEDREFGGIDMLILGLRNHLLREADEETFAENYQGPANYTDQEHAMILAAIRFFKESIPYVSRDYDYDEQKEHLLLHSDERSISPEEPLLPLTEGGFQLSKAGVYKIRRADLIARPREEDEDADPNTRPQRRQKTQLQHVGRRHLFHPRY